MKLEPKATSAEIGATIACQEARKRNPNINLKNSSIRVLKKDNKEAKDGKDGDKKDGDKNKSDDKQPTQTAVPLMAILLSWYPCFPDFFRKTCNGRG